MPDPESRIPDLNRTPFDSILQRRRGSLGVDDLVQSAPAESSTEDAPARHPTKAIVSWVLYDLANTIFSMGVVSLYFSLWIRDDVGPQRADSVLGLITAISMGIIFVSSPLLGAMTDRARRRMPFLVVSTVICVFFTAFLARGGFYVTAVLFSCSPTSPSRRGCSSTTRCCPR